MPRQLAVIALGAALCTALASGAIAAIHAGDADGVWVNGKAENLIITGPATPGTRPLPLFVIAPVSLAHPLHPFADAQTHGFGAHDHVIAIRGSVYHGACDLTLVLPGPKARIGTTVEARRTQTPTGPHPLLYGARLNGTMLPLTSAARIDSAKARGLATLLDTRTLIACRVTARTSG